jgi:hypothetical protein
MMGDYGMTDMRDGLRAGDIAYKPPGETVSERDRRVAEIIELNKAAAEAAGGGEATVHEPGMQRVMDNFWGGGNAAVLGPQGQAAVTARSPGLAKGTTENPTIVASAPPMKQRVVARHTPKKA